MRLADLYASDVYPAPNLPEAACSGMDVELFFPVAPKGRTEHYIEQRRICGGCPAIASCLAHSMQWERDGIWGGLTPEERWAFNGLRPSSASANEASFIRDRTILIYRQLGINIKAVIADALAIMERTKR